MGICQTQEKEVTDVLTFYICAYTAWPADNRSHTPHLPDLSNIPARHNIVTSPHSYGHNERLVFLFSFAELTNCIYKIFSQY